MLEIDHDVPAELGDARGDALHHVLGRRVDQPLDEVEAHALDARTIKRLEVVVREALVDERHPLGPAVRAFERIDQRPVIGVVAGRLHDDVLVEAEVVPECEQLFFRSVARGVFALRRERKRRLRPEHVAMRTDRAGRRLVRRLRRVGMKRDVAGTHGHAMISDLSSGRPRESGDPGPLQYGSPLSRGRRQNGRSASVRPARSPATRPVRRRRTWWRARACRRASPGRGWR